MTGYEPRNIRKDAKTRNTIRRRCFTLLCSSCISWLTIFYAQAERRPNQVESAVAETTVEFRRGRLRSAGGKTPDSHFRTDEPAGTSAGSRATRHGTAPSRPCRAARGDAGQRLGKPGACRSGREREFTANLSAAFSRRRPPGIEFDRPAFDGHEDS